MSGKSRQRKGKHRQQSKGKKGSRSPQFAISRQEVTRRAEEPTVIITPTPSPSTEGKTQTITNKPELVFELRRIGIFSGIMLISLILMGLFLK